MALNRSTDELTELALDNVSGGTCHPRIEALTARHENQLARIDQGVQMQRSYSRPNSLSPT